MNAGHQFPDEWSFNDFHEKAGIAFMREHPVGTARLAMHKLELIFLSVRKFGSSESHGAMLDFELTGMVVFRLIFWAAIGLCLVGVVWGWRGMRADGVVFLLLVGR